MHYNRYLYQLSGQTVANVVQISLSVANIITNSIISTPLVTDTLTIEHTVAIAMCMAGYKANSLVTW